MSKIDSFEELLSWKKARNLTSSVYELTRGGELGRDFPLRDQMRRSAVSIMANIAEGFERGGNREFQQFLSHAKGSCAELRSHLYIATDQKYISKEAFDQSVGLSLEVSRLIGGMMSYLAKSDIPGRKFKPAKSPATPPGVPESAKWPSQSGDAPGQPVAVAPRQPPAETTRSSIQSQRDQSLPSQTDRFPRAQPSDTKARVYKPNPAPPAQNSKR